MYTKRRLLFDSYIWSLFALQETVGQSEEDEGMDEETGLGGGAVILGFDFEQGPGQGIVDELESKGMGNDNKEEGSEQGCLDFTEILHRLLQILST